MFVLFGGFTPSDDTSKLGQEFTFPQSQRSEVSVISSPGHISTPFLWMSTGRAVDADRQGCLDKEGSLVRVLQLKAAWSEPRQSHPQPGSWQSGFVCSFSVHKRLSSCL